MKKILALFATMLLLTKNVCLAMNSADKQKLPKELSEMVGDTGAKAPLAFAKIRKST